ncbi:MAG: type VI secretion system contractile sheath small subunit [Planctomycetaceae bacterium]
MSESTQQVLSRVRKPRVHITYEVETEGATEVKELPFVVGVLGDFSADSTKDKPALRDRKFTQIDRDNFNDVMSEIEPGVATKVTNTLAGDDSEMSVELKFKSMDDFHPAAIIEQVEPLKKMLETRNKLRDLLTRVDRSDELEAILESVLQDTEKLQEMDGELKENFGNTSDEEKGDE